MIAQQKGRILPFHNCAFAEALSKLHLALFFFDAAYLASDLTERITKTPFRKASPAK
jgi:hypothetical protein